MVTLEEDLKSPMVNDFQKRGCTPSGFSRGENENANSNWASKMRGYPERILTVVVYSINGKHGFW